MEQNLNRAVESMISAKPDYTGEIIAIIRSPISPSVMRERLEDYHEKDIAEVLPALTSAERKKLYRILEPDMLSNILERVEGAEANTYLIEMDLRKAACYRLKEDCGLDYEPTQIVVASGAKHSVYIALMTLCNPGDEVVIAAPYWVSYSEMVKQAGAIPVIVAATEEADFKITAEQLDAAITDKTKVFMLNSPSNPTGMVYTKAELEAIAEVCCRHNIYVIADEIYCNLVYDNNEFVSFASLGEDVKERTILVNGVSKSYAMTGWRIGYSASNPQLAKVMANYLSHSTSAPSTISQQAAITALTGPQEDMQVMKQAFEQRRDHLVERMNKIEGVSCIKPEGAFYVMMNMKGFLGKTMYGKVIESAEDFAQLFLEKGLVATVPCTAFAAPGFVRWSYATSLTEIDKGLDRLEAFIKNA